MVCHPRRLFDVSKQVIGQLFVHGVNVLISDIVAHVAMGNACVLYFLNILLDTTFGQPGKFSYLMRLLTIRRSGDYIFHPTSRNILPDREVPSQGLRIRSIWFTAFLQILDSTSRSLRARTDNDETCCRRSLRRLARNLQSWRMAVELPWTK